MSSSKYFRRIFLKIFSILFLFVIQSCNNQDDKSELEFSANMDHKLSEPEKFVSDFLDLYFSLHAGNMLEDSRIAQKIDPDYYEEIQNWLGFQFNTKYYEYFMSPSPKDIRNLKKDFKFSTITQTGNGAVINVEGKFEFTIDVKDLAFSSKFLKLVDINFYIVNKNQRWYLTSPNTF